MNKEELIAKFGKCPKSKDDLHWFNYDLGDGVRACIACGQKVDTVKKELIYDFAHPPVEEKVVDESV